MSLYDDLYLDDYDLPEPTYLEGGDWRTPQHMRMMAAARHKAVAPERRSEIAAVAGRARRKHPSVPCPKCGAESSWNGKPRRICGKGHTFNG